MAEMTQSLQHNPLSSINESASLIENKQELLNSSSSIKSIDSCIKLLTEAKKTDASPIKSITNRKADLLINNPLNTYKAILAKNITKNPYISSVIKTKINDLMIDVNTRKQSYLSLYQSHSSKANTFKYNCITTSSTTSLLNKTKSKLSFRQDSLKSFNKPQLVIPSFVSSSANKATATIDLSCNSPMQIHMPNTTKTSTSNSSSHRLLSLYTTPGYKSSPSCVMINKPDIATIKRKLFEQYQKDIDELEKKLDMKTPKKTMSYNTKSNFFIHKSDFAKRKSFQYMKAYSFISKLTI